MDRQGTWEILLLPAGKNAEKGIASMKSRPRPVAGPARRRERLWADTNLTGTRGAGWRDQ